MKGLLIFRSLGLSTARTSAESQSILKALSQTKCIVGHSGGGQVDGVDPIGGSMALHGF
jgi:hypothetical protein